MERKQKDAILRDLAKKIVFITGPRQTGKTWLAKDIADSYVHPAYLNYDRREDRDIMLQEGWHPDTDLLILDELHKMPGWKNYLKGVFDTRPQHLHMLVTGSARLELLRQSGDSLVGRYFRHRLLPFTPAELKGKGFPLSRFLDRGGFPEPFLEDSGTAADRWRMLHIDGLIRSDILDFERIHDFKAVQLTLELLRARTGSPVSYRSLARDVGVAPNTVKKYIQIFESLYIVFRITPWARNIARSLMKEPKIFFFDTGMVNGDEGRKFENLAAVCLYKAACVKTDLTGREHGVYYLRTKDGLEVDFCLTEQDVPVLMIEAKSGRADIPKPLLHFHTRYGIPAMLLVKDLKRPRRSGDILVERAEEYLSSLFI